MMNSVIGVFSRGPFEAYWMKPWKASRVPAVTSPAGPRPEEVPTEQVDRAHAGRGDQHEKHAHRDDVVEPARAGEQHPDGREDVSEWTGAVQDAEVRRHPVGHLLPGVAVDGQIPGQRPVEPVQAVDDDRDSGHHEDERVGPPPPRRGERFAGTHP